MGTCKYCGKSAGFLSRVHKDCEEKHAQGLDGMSRLMSRYFDGNVSSADLAARISRNKPSYFLTDDEIADTAITVLKRFVDSLRLPYSQAVLQQIKGFISSVSVPYGLLNKSGEMDKISQKLFQGFVIDFFAKGVPMSQISINTSSVLSVLPISNQQQSEAYFNVLGKAADKFMADGFLSDSEGSLIQSYASQVGISLNDIPPYLQNGNLAKIGQAIVLNSLQKGQLPQAPLSVPVLLSRGEHALWVFDNVSMLREKITREYVGGSRGMSYRICKGLTYRTGSFKGRPVERSSMENVGVGSFVVTDKHFFFHCPMASVKIPYSKIIGVTPYSDGLEVHKEEAKPKRMVFQGFDPWFVMNVLNLISQ